MQSVEDFRIDRSKEEFHEQQQEQLTHNERVVSRSSKYQPKTGNLRKKTQVVIDNPLPQSSNSNDPVTELRSWLSNNDDNKGELTDQPFSNERLSSEEVITIQELLWSVHKDHILEERSEEMQEKILTIDTATGTVEMPFWYTTYGSKPEDGRSLWISLHGGGGCAQEVNDTQWENQKHLYSPEEGIYCAPRGPTNTWNLWHQGHIDVLFDRLIETMIIYEDVNPNKVYVLGYSAGGDGVYHLASRMADRWAGAAAIAGHPNNAKPESLRNIAFALHQGGKDSAYHRNDIALEWKQYLAKLREEDPEGYCHWVEIYEDKGHWLDSEDAQVLPWMAQQIRQSCPNRIVWLQGNHTHSRSYWLATENPQKDGGILIAEKDGQVIRIQEKGEPKHAIKIRLADRMVDLNQPVVVIRNENEVFRGFVPRTIQTIACTLAERGDPKGIYSAEIVLE